jgi:hypothetical protein
MYMYAERCDIPVMTMGGKRGRKVDKHCEIGFDNWTLL